MVLFENKELSFVPVQLKGFINIWNMVLFAWLVTCLFIGFTSDWEFISWFFLGFWTVFMGVRLYTVSSAVPIYIETLNESLRIVYSKYFIVREINVLNDDVKLELYTSPHKGRMYTTIYYLYFYSKTDNTVDIELKSYIQTLGKILNQIKQENKIYLQPRELEFIEKFRSLEAWGKTTQGKVWRILYPLLYIAGMALIVYMCVGK